MMRRRSDHVKATTTVFGLVLVLFAVALRVFHLAGEDWLVFGLAVLGAGMVRPDYIVDLTRVWRGPNPPPGPPGVP